MDFSVFLTLKESKIQKKNRYDAGKKISEVKQHLYLINLILLIQFFLTNDNLRKGGLNIFYLYNNNNNNNNNLKNIMAN